MPISLVVRDENYRHVAALEDVEASTPGAVPVVRYTVLPLGRVDEYPLLALIDPWGDTCFNRAQARVLVSELATWADDSSDDLVGLLHRAVEILVAGHMHRPHTYLWFVGD